MLITSLQNPKVKEAVRLRDRRDRDKSGLFLIEGYRELLRAADNGQPIETLFICSELFLGSNEETLINRIQGSGAHVLSCSEAVFRKLSYRDRPDGLLAIAPQNRRTLDTLALSQQPFLVVAEAIEKPGNLGTILRSSDAAAIDGLIVCDRCTDIHNPNVVRASTGTLFTVPVVEAGGDETLAWLRANDIKILAATPSAEKEYTQVDMTGPLAIAVGTEQLGLSDKWMDHADIQVRIPMCGVADSLNVAMATTLLLYEALRQRRR
ncbi:MAG: RNA methyltransferase [Chlamydiales bacterium]|nr:RNA methyltransferase [Chlamydiia bacterium]MCP5508696.1 RNA methyltransferase [Chlamydiales bacterium]